MIKSSEDANKYYNLINVTARNDSFSHKILHTLIEKPFKTNFNSKIFITEVSFFKKF